jgi:thymidylate synthase ThyX
MRIVLAGYNIDLDALQDEKSILTPETFSAAYARISRSPKSIPELRAIANKEIAKTRAQNQRIIYEMGHHSIAEHAVFNFDIINISRLAVEHLESHRLNSYTEASQRYIQWSSKFVIPEEIKKTKLLQPFLKTVKLQNQTYQNITTEAQSHRGHSEKKKILSIPSKESYIPIEDTRYVTSLAMATQLGATLNARNLELIIRRFAASDISEVRTTGKKLYNLAIKVAPSIILFYEPTEYDKKTYSELQKFYHRDTPHLFLPCKENGLRLLDKSPKNLKIGAGEPEAQREHRDFSGTKHCKLVDYTRNGDDKIIAGIMHRTNNLSFAQALEKVRKMSKAKKLEYVKKAFQYAKLYDVTLREFEHCFLTFEVVVSAACFGQLKRHRLATITAQDYDVNLGVTIPDSIKQGKQIDLFNKVIAETEKTYNKIYKDLPQIAPYILTQAHRRRVLLTVNIRELYHIARLRMDKTAQWDIRKLTTDMVEQAQKVMPLSCMFCGAKDQFQNWKLEIGK